MLNAEVGAKRYSKITVVVIWWVQLVSLKQNTRIAWE
jgi:hypothetical protein